MYNPEAVELFRRLLMQEIDCAQRLMALLDEERQALGGRDAQALEQVTEAKRALLAETEQRVAAHEGFLSARRLPAGRAGTERFLSGLPKDAAERSLWQRLQELAAACREANEVNGRVVALSRIRVQRTLELLHGQPDAGKTYGKAGQSQSSARRTYIGSV